MRILTAITAYNQPRYTAAALASVRGSDLALLDDCSLEDLHPIAKHYKALYHRNEENLGLTSLWNKAVQMAAPYDVLIISNNDVLFSREAVFRMVDSLLFYDAVGPMTNAPGHSPQQNIRKVYPGYAPSDIGPDIETVSEAIASLEPAPIARLNGFCMAFKVRELYADMRWPDTAFNPDVKFALYGAEDEYFRSVKPKAAIARNAFVLHYKQVTMESTGRGWTNYKKQWVRK